MKSKLLIVFLTAGRSRADKTWYSSDIVFQVTYVLLKSVLGMWKGLLMGSDKQEENPKKP